MLRTPSRSSSSTSVGFSPASTSSSNSSLGRAASARATSRRFFPAIVSEPRRVISPICQTYVFQDFQRDLARRFELSGPAEAGADGHVFQHVIPYSGFTIWWVRVCRGALLRSGERFVMSWPVKPDPSGSHLVNAIDHVKERRLARAVGTDQPKDLAFSECEAYVRHRHQPAKAPCYAAHLQ